MKRDQSFNAGEDRCAHCAHCGSLFEPQTRRIPLGCDGFPGYARDEYCKECCEEWAKEQQDA